MTAIRKNFRVSLRHAENVAVALGQLSANTISPGRAGFRPFRIPSAYADHDFSSSTCYLVPNGGVGDPCLIVINPGIQNLSEEGMLNKEGNRRAVKLPFVTPYWRFVECPDQAN